MANYQRQPNKAIWKGMNVTVPGDRLPLDYAQLLKNVRSYIIGEWRQRPALDEIADVDGGANDPILWITRINDIESATFRRLVGTSAGNIYVDDVSHTTYSLADSGFSALPNSSVIARPDRSANPYVFVANTGKQQKFDILGVPSEWGLVAPTEAPTAELFGVVYTVVDHCFVLTGWTGVNGVASLQTRVNTTIDEILYDTSAPCFASIAPVVMDENIQPGATITIDPGVESPIVEQTFQPITSTTIAGINYDSGSTGMCTIELATPTSGLERDSTIVLGGTENVRVLSVTLGLDGIPSIRCSTVGTFAASDTVDGLRTYRSFVNGTYAAGTILTENYVQIAVAGAGIATLQKTNATDMSIAGLGGPRPIQPEDFVHCSILVEDFSLVDEIQIQFDCDATTNDFTKNYFFKSLRPPDLQSAYAQSSTSLTAQQQQIQRGQIDTFAQQELLSEKAALEARLAEPDLPYFPKVLATKLLEEVNRKLGEGFNIGSDEGVLSDPGVGGASQWTELFIPISSFQRVGSDLTRGWADVQAYGISIQATGAVDVGVSAIWVGGTFGPNTMGTPGYTYSYRARNTQTGTVSNPSPPMRSPVLPKRDQVVVRIPSGYPDPQVDVFDVFRIGGTLGDYHFVGTASPTGGMVLYDDLPDDTVVRNPILEFDRFKPWPITDNPRSGRCNVVGTQVIRTSGDDFNVQWVRGNAIIINQQAYTFYSNPTDIDHVELNESAGNGVDFVWEMQSPTLDSQPKGIVFGPYGTGVSGEFLFSVGDPLNPGYIAWTNGNDPESASDSGQLELCSPSEPLMTGTVIDGIVYCYSDRRSWRILPSFSGGQSGSGSDFYAQETSMGKGVASRWGLTVGDQMYFIAYDGVYASKGDAVISLTDDALAPIFRRDGSTLPGTLLGGQLEQISFDSADEQYLSLTYSKDGLYMTYRSITGNLFALYYGFLNQGWSLDEYAGPFSNVTRYYREQGGAGVDDILVGTGAGTINFLSQDSTSDNGTPYNCEILSRYEDFGDYRAQKQIGDVMVDIEPDSQTVFASLIYDQGDTSTNLDNITGTTRAQFVRDIDSGDGDLKRQCSLQLTWLGLTGITKVYGWEPAALIKPEYTMKRATDWEDGGYVGPKWLQGMRLRADTYNQLKDIQVQGDEGTLVSNLEITHNGESTKEYWWDPVVTHQMRIIGEDDLPWREMGIEWIFEPEPGLAAIWHMQYSDLDNRGYLHIRDLLIAHRSSSDITLSLYWDGFPPDSYTIPNSSNERAKTYLPVLAKKGKLTKLVFTAETPFALYIKDIEVRAKSWGLGTGYQVTKPFGDLTRTNLGARI